MLIFICKSLLNKLDWFSQTDAKYWIFKEFDLVTEIQNFFPHVMDHLDI